MHTFTERVLSLMRDDPSVNLGVAPTPGGLSVGLSGLF